MTTVKLVIGYEGTDFHGFARQDGLRTVQSELELTLQRVLGYHVEVFGSGRTDAGVHARAQVVHFVQDAGPPADRYPYVLRRCLPPDIVAVAAEAMPTSFHARFSAVGKTYRYTLQTAATEDIFTKRFASHVPWPLNFDLMQEAAQILVGEHDFTSFCAAATETQNKRRTIYRLSVVPRGTYVDVYCTGSGFLQHMVRIIVGTLLTVGRGRMTIQQLADILAAKDRRHPGRTAPARGLSLWQVYYSKSELETAVERSLDPLGPVL